MTQLLRPASGPGLLETAFDAMKSKRKNSVPTKETATDLYNKFFVPLSGAAQGKPFERFSLTDPTIRTFIASTTDIGAGHAGVE